MTGDTLNKFLLLVILSLSFAFDANAAILLPAFEESAVIEQLTESLDYPKSKLDVKFLTESDDQEMGATIGKYIHSVSG
jgi:hypothetical protein